MTVAEGGDGADAAGSGRGVDTWFRIAMRAQRQGRLSAAESAYREVLARDPDHADALHLLASIAAETDRTSLAIELERRALERRDDARFHSTLGQIFRRAGDLDAAAAAFRLAIAKDARLAEPCFHLAELQRSLGNMTEAERCYRQAIGRRSDYLPALVRLGTLLLDEDDPDAARDCLLQAHAVRPDDPDILYSLGYSTLKREPGTAAGWFRQALARRADHAGALVGLGRAYTSLDQPDLAEAAFQQALTIDARSADACLGLARLRRAWGRHDEALQLYRQAIDIDPTSEKALSALAEIDPTALDSPIRDRLAQLADDAALPSFKRRRLHFALAAIHEARDDCGAAFRHWTRGNEIRRAQLIGSGAAYDPATETALVQRLVASFDSAHFHRVAGMGNADPLPVFIVGMPRSGTSLIEQILAGHSRFHGAGELRALDDIAARLPAEVAGDGGPFLAYPECVTELAPATLRRLADAHLTALRELDPRAVRVADKAPLNFRHLGLVATLFPNARILHCRRDPVDTCLSCYKQDFAAGLHWSVDQTWLGHNYRLYRRLMAHWDDVLPIPVLGVDYEEVVGDLEGVARRIVAFCGLEWQPDCLEFQRVDRPVHTATLDQVRRPVYGSSIGRWRRYESHLAPLLVALSGVDHGDAGQ